MDSSSRRSLAAALAPAATPPMIKVFIVLFSLRLLLKYHIYYNIIIFEYFKRELRNSLS